ncbi:HIT family protein [Bacillus sp. FJAT-18019]|nr:HIT family protein [Bacillus sp. FJAT-18019]
MQEDIHFRNIEYLHRGSAKQRDAALVIDELGIMDHLKSYDPILVGTIPIGIDIAGSDLDIICCVSDFTLFEREIKSRYSSLIPELTCTSRIVNKIERMVVRFQYKDWDFEIFAQPVPSSKQNGYRHMMIEHKLLNQLGEAAKQRIIELKRSGFKTEPAFAELLNIPGDPYEELLNMSSWSEDQLDIYISNLDMDKERCHE